MGLVLTRGQKLVMIGDSITDAGRARPLGTFASGLGSGYVSLVDALLRVFHRSSPIDVVNVGISGNTVRDLKGRWLADVVDQKPDWLTIMIGTNDVWRQFDGYDPAAAVLEDEFAATLGALLDETLPLVTGIALMTPFLVEQSLSDPFKTKMDDYGAIVKAIGIEKGIQVVDTQAAFDRVLRCLPVPILAPDRVHPTLPGHLVLAKALLAALGFSWTGEPSS